VQQRHGINGHLIGFHLEDHEGTVTLSGNHVFNQFLRTALTVISQCVNQRQLSERPADRAMTEIAARRIRIVQLEAEGVW
jgi:hypothetical protein